MNVYEKVLISIKPSSCSQENAHADINRLHVSSLKKAKKEIDEMIATSIKNGKLR